MPSLAPPPFSFYSFSVHVASRCWIYPASSLGRRFGETKLSKVDMINCFYFVSFVSSPPALGFFFFLFFVFLSLFIFFYISRTVIRDLHCFNGWLFWFFFTVVLCLQLVSMILLPANLDGPLCSSSMIIGSVHHTSLHFFFTSMSLWGLGLGSAEISFHDDETRKN